MVSSATWLQALSCSVQTRSDDGSKFFLFTTQAFHEEDDGSIYTTRRTVATDELHKERIAHYLDALEKGHQPWIPAKSGKKNFWRVDFDHTESSPPENMKNLAKKI